MRTTRTRTRVTGRMRRGTLPVWAALAALVIPVATASTEDKKLPPAEVILDKAVEALGGKAALEKLHSRVIKGTFEISGAGIKGPLELYLAPPRKQYLMIDLGAQGKLESGTKGEVAWEMTTIMGARILEGDERALSLRNATFNAELKWRELYRKVECVERTEIDGKPCYKVVMTPKQGSPVASFYDAKSFLLMRSDFTVNSALGPVQVSVSVSDYRPVDGVLIPRKSTQSIGGGVQTQVLTFDKIEHNVDIPDERFALPAPVQALLEKAKKKNTRPDAERE